MRKILLEIDLAICSLWTIAALGSRMAWVDTPAIWIVMLLIMSRLLLSFTLYHREKKSWIPGLLFMGLTVFAISTELDIKLSELASKVFPLLNLDFNRWWYVGLILAVATWLWVVPLVVFLVNIFRKGCLTDTLTWTDTLGKLLWTDKTARTYCSLLLITIGTLYTGLTMNARLCLFASVVAPTLSFYLLKRYYGLEKGKVWVLVISMLIFFFAQTHAGLLRMSMLGISFSMVAYVCSSFYQKDKKLLLSVIVYYSTDRRNWTLYRKIEGSELPSKRLVSYSYYFSTPANYTIKGLPAGEYYFAFGAGYTYVDNIYGCKRVDVAHDFSISDQTLPASAMVNHEYTASVTVKNINAKAEEASSYKAELYVGEEKVAEKTGEEVIDAGGQTTLSLSYVPHTVGTQKAYVMVRSLLDDYAVASDTTEVSVAKEVGEAELVVGDGKGTSTTNVPYYFYNADNAQGAQVDIIYSPDMLKAYGLKAGQKISSVTYNGTATATKEYKSLNLTVFVGTTDATDYVANTDTAELQRVALYENAPYTFTSGEPFDTQVRLEEPIVWDGEKALRVFTYAQASTYTKVQYATDNTYKTAYYKKGSATSFSTSNTPVVTLGVAYDPFILSGKITAAGEPVANACVKATDGNVYYSAETSEDGTYSLTIYQSDRKYKLTVAAEGYEDYAAEDSIELTGDVEKNVELVKKFHAVKGVVVYKSAPVAGAKVTLTNRASETVEATTGEDGAYAFDSVYHGKKYKLAVAAEGYISYEASDSVEVADTDVEIDTIALTKPFVEVSGTVKCGEAPIAGAQYALLSNAAGAVEVAGTTNEEGKFLIAAEQDQKYMLTVTADGYEPFILEDSVVFTANHDFGDIQLKALSVTIIVPDGKVLAFCSEKALDFSALEGFKAYVVTAVEKKNDAAFTKLAEVTAVPANTGVIIVAAPGDYEAPVAKEAPAVEKNLLVSTASAPYTIKFDDAYEIWALGLSDNDKPAFTTTIGTEIPQGSAYLRKVSDAEIIYLYEADVPEPDAIRSVEGGALDLNADMFNTSGQKVDKSYHGIVIQNGKKFSKK